MIWLTLICYLSVCAMGAYLIWKAYQLGIKKNFRHAKKLNGAPYKNPQRFVQKIAITDFVVGLAIILFAISIPLLKVNFETWGSFIGGVGLIRMSILMGFAKKDET